MRDDPPLEIRPTSGDSVQVLLADLIAGDDVPRMAAYWIKRFGLDLEETIDGLDVWMWIASRGGASFCISCDDWMRELTIMPWEGTSASALEDLIRVDASRPQRPYYSTDI